MSSRIRGSFGLALALGASLAAVTLVIQAQASPEAEFKKLADDFSAAWGKGDAKAIAALHTEDAVRLNGDGTVARGRPAIEQGMTEALAGPWKGTTLTITANPSKRVTDDVYLGEGKYQVSGGMPPAGAPTSGSYMNTLVRSGGRWLIAGSAIVSPPPAPK